MKLSYKNRSKDWDLEKLENYEFHLKDMVSALDMQQATQLASENAQIQRATYEANANSDEYSQGYGGPEDYGVTYAYDSKDYKYAIDTLEEDYNDTSIRNADKNIEGENARNLLNEVRKNLAIKYLEADDFPEAILRLNALGDKDSKKFNDPELKEKVFNALKNDKENLSINLRRLERLGFPVNEFLQDPDIYSAELSDVKENKAEPRYALFSRTLELGNIDDIQTLSDRMTILTEKDLVTMMNRGVDINYETVKKVSSEISFDTLKLAIDKNVNEDAFYVLVDKADYDYQKRALEYAIIKNKTKLQNILIDGLNVSNDGLLAKDGSFLALAVEKGNVKTVANLLLNGASIHVDEKELAQALKEASPEIRDIIDNYTKLENKFKSEVQTKINEWFENLEDDKITNDTVIQQVNNILYGVYDNILQPENDKQCKLDFVEQAILSIKSALESIVSDKTYKQLKFEKMAEAIYEKMQGTEEFKKISAIAVGKEVSEGLESNQKGGSDKRDYEIKGKYTANYVEERSQPTQERQH